MSLNHSYRRARVYVDPMFNDLTGEIRMKYEPNRTYLPLHDLTFKFEHVVIKLYTLDFYGMSYYHRPWDYWRKNLVQYTIHLNGHGLHFPFYIIRRSKIFNNNPALVVDK